MHDPHDPDAVADAQDTAQAEAAELAAAWRWLCRDQRGRRVLSDLMRITNYMGGSYVGGDALATAYNEGRRSVGGAVYAAVMATSPKQWTEIHRMLAKPRET